MNALAIEANVMLGARYRLVEPAHHRGAGEVWYVTDEQRRGDALLAKVLRPVVGVAMPGEMLSAVRALAALRHPAAPAALEYGIHAGRPWVIHADTPGTSLSALLDQASATSRPLDLAFLREAFDSVASTVITAHTAALPLAHGALTSASVISLAMPTQRAAFALLDLGIAQWLDAPPRGARALAARAPESLTGAPVTTATDVFALGALFTELFTLPGESRRPDVPPSVWRVIAAAMAPTPSARYASVSTFVAALDHAWRERASRSLAPPVATPDHTALLSSGALLDRADPASQDSAHTLVSKPVVRARPEPYGAPPLSTDGALPLAPVPVSSVAPSRLAQLVGAAPATSTPWDTEVRQRQVPVPAAMANAGDSDQTLIAAPKPRPIESDGETWIAAPHRPSPLASQFSPPPVPMNVPDGTLVAAAPVMRPRVQPPPQAPMQPPTPQPSPKPASRAPVIAIAVVVIVAALIAALKIVG